MSAPTYELQVPLVDHRPPLTANLRLHWREDAKLRAMVRQQVGWRARQAKVGRWDHIEVQLHYVPLLKRRRDPANLMPTQKPAVDGLVDAGVVPDDTPEFVTELVPVIHEPTYGVARLWLAVRPVERLSAAELAAIDEDVKAERAADAATWTEENR